MMEGRRYSDGLHQSIEAKEGVQIQSENQTLASITFQNYFRLYPKLSGMTGTAMTEEAEFNDIYGLCCVEIPTNRPVQRKDEHDVIYRTEKEKYKAIIDTILECHKKASRFWSVRRQLKSPNWLPICCEPEPRSALRF